MKTRLQIKRNINKVGSPSVKPQKNNSVLNGNSISNNDLMQHSSTPKNRVLFSTAKEIESPSSFFNKKQVYDVEVQTDDIILKSKDELLLRVQELTDQRNSLIDHIQSLSSDSSSSLKEKEKCCISCNCNSYKMQIDILNREILQLTNDKEKLMNTILPYPLSNRELSAEVTRLTRLNDHLQNKICELVNTNVYITQKLENLKVVPNALARDNNVFNTDSFHEVKKDLSNIFVFADSQGRFVSSYLNKDLGDKFKTLSFVYSGAKGTQILRRARGIDFQCNSMDFILLMVGTNDLSSSRPLEEGGNLVRSLSTFISNFTQTNVIISTIPYRYDLPSDSLVNQAIKHINNQIRALVSGRTNVFLVDVFFYYRKYFSNHGLHLNKSGKKHLCREIKKIVELYSQINLVAVNEKVDHHFQMNGAASDTVNSSESRSSHGFTSNSVDLNDSLYVTVDWTASSQVLNFSKEESEMGKFCDKNYLNDDIQEKNFNFQQSLAEFNEPFSLSYVSPKNNNCL